MRRRDVDWRQAGGCVGGERRVKRLVLLNDPRKVIVDRVPAWVVGQG